MKYKVIGHQAVVLLSAFVMSEEKKKDEARLTSEVPKPDSNTQTVTKTKAKTLILMGGNEKSVQNSGVSPFLKIHVDV